MVDKSIIDDIYDWADKKRQKYFEEYQVSGSASQQKTFERYDDICSICQAAYKSGQSEDEFRGRIRTWQYQVIDQLGEEEKFAPTKTFSYEEMRAWLNKMIF